MRLVCSSRVSRFIERLAGQLTQGGYGSPGVVVIGRQGALVGLRLGSEQF